MTLQEARNLKIGVTIFHEYGKSEVKSEVRDYGNGQCITVQKGNFLGKAYISNIFLPTEHVETISNMVAEKKKEFSEINCDGAHVNPDIFELFENHWISMCSAEGNDAQYQIHKAAFEEFIKELFKVVNIVNNATVMDIPYLRR